MNPQIEFRHVLGELSVNRNDPCEVLRELVSNSYDAGAKNILYAPLNEENGLIFFDDGTGLSTTKKSNGITPWEAFFSIGKSTKKKGEAIGYKCQGSKLCFASSRILVATKKISKNPEWHFKIVDNPRTNLDTAFNITPESATDIKLVINSFFPSPSEKTHQALSHLLQFISEKSPKTATLIIIDKLDTESFGKYFSIGKHIEESYLFNYIRFYTKHGDTRWLEKNCGFNANQIAQVSASIKSATLSIFYNKKMHPVPFGYPFLETSADSDIKSPSQVSRLRDGRFYSRGAKSFNVAGSEYSIVMLIDGNRRAHDEYKNLDRKGSGKSGIRLADQRGFFISVNGIKICKYLDIFSSSELEDYQILAEGESPNHYSIFLDGDFDLVTNRNSLSKKAFDTLSSPTFLLEIKKFFDHQKKSDKVFYELMSRMKKESTENKLNEQMEILEESRGRLKSRERFRITDKDGYEHLFLSPLPGEEYLVGVLYAVLSNLVPHDTSYDACWKRIITFSTQGIDSLGFKDEQSSTPLAKDNILSIEYKYGFSNDGPFNHALAIVDYIIAWEVDLSLSKLIKDAFTCFGKIRRVPKSNFQWEIYEIENTEGGCYKDRIVKVICLRKLIEQTFGIAYVNPN